MVLISDERDDIIHVFVFICKVDRTISMSKGLKNTFGVLAVVGKVHINTRSYAKKGHNIGIKR